MGASSQCSVSKLGPQESVAAVSAGNSGSGRLWVWAGWTWMDWPQIYDPLTIRPRAGDPLRCDLADEKTVTRAAHIFLACRSILYGCGFIADAALDHMLMDFALNTNE